MNHDPKGSLFLVNNFIDIFQITKHIHKLNFKQLLGCLYFISILISMLHSILPSPYPSHNYLFNYCYVIQGKV